MHTHPATQDNSNVIDKDSHGAIPPRYWATFPRLRSTAGPAR